MFLTKLKKSTVIFTLATICSFYAVYIWYSNCKRISTEISFSEIKQGENATVYAAYSADGTVPDYVVSYLKKLKEVSPNIIYITDNPIVKRDINKLKPYISHLIATRHGEYDWGSYKRGATLLQKKGWFENAGNLIFANDSVLLVTPTLSPYVRPYYTPSVSYKNVPPIPPTPDFWGITANQDGEYHLQSYFLVFTPQVIRHPAFMGYLKRVKAQKDGLTVAYTYEVPFTKFLESLGFRSAAHIPYDQLKSLPFNDKNCYPLTMLSKYNAPFLKMRTFTERLNVQEPRRLVFQWLKKNNPAAYKDLIKHLKHIKSPYLVYNH